MSAVFVRCAAAYGVRIGAIALAPPEATASVRDCSRWSAVERSRRPRATYSLLNVGGDVWFAFCSFYVLDADVVP